MSDVKKPTRDEINEMRLRAFKTNNHDDRMVYYKACSGWFQDEDHRELERAEEITALRARLEELEAERDELAAGDGENTRLMLGAQRRMREYKARAERAEAALATARRDALEEAAALVAFDAEDKFAPMVRSFNEAFSAGCRCAERSIRALANEADKGGKTDG